MKYQFGLGDIVEIFDVENVKISCLTEEERKTALFCWATYKTFEQPESCVIFPYFVMLDEEGKFVLSTWTNIRFVVGDEESELPNCADNSKHHDWMEFERNEDVVYISWICRKCGLIYTKTLSIDDAIITTKYCERCSYEQNT